MARQQVGLSGVLLTILVILIPSGVRALVPDADLSKVLVGTWKGEFTGHAAGPGAIQYPRTVIIKSLHQENGKWIIDSIRFATGGAIIHPVVEVVNGKVTLEMGDMFKGGKFSLTLQGDDLLGGYIETPNISCPCVIYLRKIR